MIRAFLSASVPLPDRNPKYMQTADIIGIREAVKALVGEIVPDGSISFGGHPAITPLIAVLLRTLGNEARQRIVLYQSGFFKDNFVKENDEFIALKIVPPVRNSRKHSIAAMRAEMIDNTNFDVGVFIGGMEGVIEEYTLFTKRHPHAAIWPIASTGAAAKEIFENRDRPRPELFLNEITYPSLFRALRKDLRARG